MLSVGTAPCSNCCVENGCWCLDPQWAAITLIIVGTAEYVGAAAWIAMQRLAGNIIGGYLGYAGQQQQ